MDAYVLFQYINSYSSYLSSEWRISETLCVSHHTGGKDDLSIHRLLSTERYSYGEKFAYSYPPYIWIILPSKTDPSSNVILAFTFLSVGSDPLFVLTNLLKNDSRPGLPTTHQEHQYFHIHFLNNLTGIYIVHNSACQKVIKPAERASAEPKFCDGNRDLWTMFLWSSRFISASG